MDEQKNGVVHVLAPDFDPLLNTANANGIECADAIGQMNGAVFRNGVLQVFSVR